MEFALQVASYMVDLICEKISNMENISQDDIAKYYLNDNVRNKNDLEVLLPFLKKYFYLVDNDMLYDTWSILVSYQTIYDDKIDFFAETNGNNEQYNWDFALPFMAVYKMINDYTTPRKDKTINYFKKATLKKFKKDFLYKDRFGMSVLYGFLKAICDDDIIENNEKVIQENENDYKVITNWRQKLCFRVSDLNDMLRTTFYDLYAYYLNQGNIKSNISSYIWAYFKNDFDPVKSLEKYGFADENINNCKHLMIKLMLADLYEDSKNNKYDKEWFTLNDFGDSVDDDKLMSMMKSNYDSAFYLELAKRNDFYEEVINNKFLAEILFYNYCEVLDDPNRMAANRRKTFKEERQLELAKINPNYVLDEF